MIESILLMSPMGYTLGMFMLVTVNYFLVLGKSKLIKKLNFILSFFLFISGIVTTVMIRSILLKKTNSPRFDYSLVEGGLRKFDVFYKVSIIILIAMFAFLLFLLFISKSKSNRLLIESFQFLFITTNIIAFFGGLVFSYFTINKFINIPSYVLVLVISEVSIFHLLLLIKRILDK